MKEVTMGKIKKIAYVTAGVIGAALLGIAGMRPERAQAACGYGVFAEDFYAPCENGEREDGVIKVQRGEIDGVDTLKITLHDYRGSGIDWQCCGTCEGVIDAERVVVEVIGDNSITEPGGTGIAFRNAEFTGSGSLTIEAMIPVGKSVVEACGDPENSQYIPGVDETLVETFGNTKIKVDLSKGDGGTINNEQPGAEQEEKPEVPADEKKDDGLVWHIVAGVYMVAVTITVIALGAYELMRRKKVEVKPVERKQGGE